MNTGVSSLLKNLHGQITNNNQTNNTTNNDPARGSQVIYQAPWGPVTKSNVETQTVNHGPWGASRVESAAQTVYHAPWGPVTRSDSDNQSAYLAPWGLVTQKPEQRESSPQSVQLTPWGPIPSSNYSEGSSTTNSVVLPGGPPPRQANAGEIRHVDVSLMFMKSQGDLNTSRWRPDAKEVPAPPLQDSQNIPQCTTYNVVGTSIVQQSCLKGEPIVPPSSGPEAAPETRIRSVPIPPALLICASLD